MKKWEQITVGLYKKLYHCKNEFEILSVLSGIEKNTLINGSVEILKSLRKEFYTILYEKMPIKTHQKLEICGKSYFFEPYSISAGQFADIQVLTTCFDALKIHESANGRELTQSEIEKISVLTSDKIIFNINTIIAILIKPKEVLYSDWNTDILIEKIEEASIVEVYGLLNFFTLSPKKLEKNMQDFLKMEVNQTKLLLKQNQSLKYGLNYLLSYPKMIYLNWILLRIKI